MPTLSPTHLAAIARRRRLIVNFDVTFAINVQHRRNPDRPDLVEHLFEFADAPRSQIDSIWWNWGEGNQAPYPSQHLPLYDHPLYQKWADEGTDIVGQVLAATHRRGLECFFSHRMNGSDNDLGPFARIPEKVAHPDWLFRTPWCTHADNGYWNFALPQVREYVLRNLREVIERWPFDGMELDFARGVVFPAGQGWPNRERLTEFIARLRELSLAVGVQRGRPLLLAARIPETLVGCHFDGIDVERWVGEQLIDLLALGVRSFEVDLADFRHVVAGTPVKLYPSLDDHHATDGYQNPGIEVLRGVAANWWRQGADGIHTFNFNYATDAPYAGQDWASHRRAYQELGAVETLRAKDKCFVVQRRGGGHGLTVIPNPEDWATPRHNYANTNMLAQLPAAVPNDGHTDLLLQIHVGLDLAAERIAAAELRLLLSDPSAADLPETQRLPPVQVATIGHPDGELVNIPAAQGVERTVQIRLNNALLEQPTTDDGWLVWPVEGLLLAAGANLVGISAQGRTLDAPQLVVEKLEIAVVCEAVD